MNDLEQALAASDGSPPTFKLALLSLVGALILGQVLSAAYVWSYRGMSYTRSHVHSITIAAIVVAMIMMAVNNNLAAGVGILGSLAVLRLRISMRDPKDLLFMFAGVGVGVGCGLRAFTVALAGTLVFSAAAVILALFDVGQRHLFEGVLRFRAPADSGTERAIDAVLQKYAKHFALVTLREIRQGDAVEYAYQVRLRRANERVALVRELEGVDAVDGVTLYYQDAAQEL
jgi:hypothetical protein